ncbi:MAG: energy transducer TonB [Chitinophagales bacterium]|nr:energy transducer TonB [Chitinophagales bacterium]
MKQILLMAFTLSAFSLYAQTGVDKFGIGMPVVDSIYSAFDEIPEPLFNLQEYFKQNIRYPDEAQKYGIEGEIAVSFVVDTNGNVINPVALGKGAKDSPLLADEAVSLIKNMPKWEPAKYKGKSVNVRFYQKLSWRLS